jgi:hypothetical protein
MLPKNHDIIIFIKKGVLMAAEKKTVHDFEFVGRLINIMKILQEETDEYHTITQPEILDLLRDRDCACSERTLTDYLKTIMKELNPEDVDGYVYDNATIEDYVIIAKGLEDKLKAKDYGLEAEGSKKLQLRSLRYNQLLSFAELNQVIEGVLFLKHIDDESKEKIIHKLIKLSSRHFPESSPYISGSTGAISKKIAGVFEDSRVDEAALKNNMQMIRRAIEADRGAGVKIAFHFNGYDEKKKLVPRLDADGNKIRYVANPYYIIMYNGKPYLICAVDPYDNAAIYRIDLMSDITMDIKKSLVDEDKMIGEKRKPKSEIEGLPMDWNSKEAGRFQTEHLYMYYGKPESITLKLDRARYTLLHDYFGDRYQFVEHIDDRWDCVQVKCVPEAMISWAMQCSDFVEVLQPEDLRRKMLEKCKGLVERYQ